MLPMALEEREVLTPQRYVGGVGMDMPSSEPSPQSGGREQGRESLAMKCNALYAWVPLSVLIYILSNLHRKPEK